MPTVNYLDPSGKNHEVEVPHGQSLMEGAVRHGVPGMLGECGGNLSCATCHVYVEAAWSDAVGACESGSLEDEMLDNVSSERLPTSRLSCQVHMGSRIEGVVVRIAPSQT